MAVSVSGLGQEHWGQITTARPRHIPGRLLLGHPPIYSVVWPPDIHTFRYLLKENIKRSDDDHHSCHEECAVLNLISF